MFLPSHPFSSNAGDLFTKPKPMDKCFCLWYVGAADLWPTAASRSGPQNIENKLSAVLEVSSLELAESSVFGQPRVSLLDGGFIKMRVVLR